MSWDAHPIPAVLALRIDGKAVLKGRLDHHHAGLISTPFRTFSGGPSQMAFKCSSSPESTPVLTRSGLG